MSHTASGVFVPMRFSVYQLSRKGGREKNEDRVGYCYTRDCGLFAVADGMGGHPEGEVASRLALQALAAVFQRDAVPALAEPSRFLLDAVLAGHHELLRYAGRQALVDTPRTTVVACVLQGHSAYWAHCGDSRLYLMRGERLIGRTRDHSYSELQDAMSTVLPARERYNRNVLFTCLGGPAKPVVDTVGPLQLQPGDRVLLCSDGLWGNVSDTVITQPAVRPADRRGGARAGRARAAQRRRALRQCHRAGHRMGIVGGRRRAGRRVDAGARRRGLRLDDPGRLDRLRRPHNSTDSTTTRSSARSARSTKPSVVRPGSASPERRGLADRPGPDRSGACINT